MNEESKYVMYDYIAYLNSGNRPTDIIVDNAQDRFDYLREDIVNIPNAFDVTYVMKGVHEVQKVLRVTVMDLLNFMYIRSTAIQKLDECEYYEV